MSSPSLSQRLTAAKHYQGQAAHHVRVTRRAFDVAVMRPETSLEDLERMMRSCLSWAELERDWRSTCAALASQLRLAQR